MSKLREKDWLKSLEEMKHPQDHPNLIEYYEKLVDASRDEVIKFANNLKL